MKGSVLCAVGDIKVIETKILPVNFILSNLFII